MVNADALRTGLEKGSYDVVHERLVLINVPIASQEAILAEMFSLTRPGGIIALQEFDSASYVCYSLKAHVEVAQIGEYRRTHLLSLIESMRDLVLASGRIEETELGAHMAALSEHLADPGTTLIDKLIVQAWGHRPS